MLIKSIYLKGYKPFFLNPIKSINITFDSNLVLIIATNGAGKSSLLRELTPLPATPVNFKEGGEKHITIEYNGDLYTLSSFVNKSARHTLIKNGVKVHSLVTTEVHRTKVIEIFRYDYHIHKLLIGELKFTDMGPQARKDILTLINPLELDWALKFYSDIKDQVKETQTLLKHVTTKNANAKTNLNSLKIPEDITLTKSRIEEEVSILLPFSLIEVKEKHISLVDSLNRLSKIEKIVKEHPLPNISNPLIHSDEDFTLYINSVETKLAVTQAEINSITNELFSLDDVSNALLSNDMTKEELEEKYHHFNELLKSSFSLPSKEFVEYRAILEDIDGVQKVIQNIHSWIPSKNIPLEERSNITKCYNTVLGNKSRLERLLSVLKDTLDHCNNPTSVINCPNCSTGFNRSGEDIETLKKKTLNDISKYENELKDIPEKIEFYSQLSEDINKIETAETKLRNIKKTSSSCIDFWIEIEDTEVLFCEDVFTYKLQQFKNHVRYFKEKKEIMDELGHLEKTLNLVKKYGTKTDVRVLQLNETLSKKRELIHTLTKESESMKKIKKQLEKFDNIFKEYETILKQVKEKTDELAELGIKKDAKDKLSKCYSELAGYNELTNKFTNLSNIVNELDKEQEEYTKRLKNLQLIESTISPNSGLIASQMSGFIKNYLNRLNRVTNKVWSYQIEVEPCLLENGNLNYKFPAIIENMPIPDIVEGSKSQREIVNLAFTIVMRKYLGLTNYPMYMDEIGASWDDVHRLSLVEFVKDFLEENQCSQLFFVNHYDTIFNAFSNTDTVVLDNKNVTVSNPYNQNVVFNEDYKPC